MFFLFFLFFPFLWNYRAGLFVSLRITQYWFCFEMVQLLNFILTKLTFWKTPRRRTSMNTEIEGSWMKNIWPLDPFFKFTRMQLVSMLSNLTHHQSYFYWPYRCHRLLSNHLTNTTTWYLQKLLQISLSISFPDSLATFLSCDAYRPRKWSAKQLNAGTC